MTICCVDCAYFEDWDLRHHSGACRLANKKDAPMSLRDPEERLFVTSNHTCGGSKQREVRYRLQGSVEMRVLIQDHTRVQWRIRTYQKDGLWSIADKNVFLDNFETIPPKEAL